MRIIKDRGLLTINKQEIDALIAAKNFVGLNQSPRAEKVIVSITSYKPRIHDVKYAIYSLLNQTFPPDKLILWLNEEFFPRREDDLPSDLLELRAFGLTIEWCENLKPHTKYFYALKNYPDAIIATADDDIFYRPDWLKILYDEHIENPQDLIAHRCHRIRIDVQGRLLAYNEWHFEVNPTPPHRYGNFITSVGGVLYSRKILHRDVLRSDIFTKLTPLNDDIWIWAMAVLNGTKIRIPVAAMNTLIYIDVDMQHSGETLFAANKTQNDVQLQQVMEHYPALLDALIREATECKPYISVVMPIKNPANFPACFESIFEQNFPDFEFIAVNLGARMDLPPMPTRVCSHY